MDYVFNTAGSVPPEQSILVVEDDPFWQKVISRNIQIAAGNCHISLATNAREALVLLGLGRHYNLIVADYFLEGDMTGYELLCDCKKRGVEAPFLLTSGQIDFPEDKFKKLSVHFVSKPFVAFELRRNLGNLLNRHTANRKFELKLLFVMLALIALSVFLGLDPPASDGIPTLRQDLLAPPPSMRIYDLPTDGRGHFITPSLLAKVSVIVKRADEILSMPYLTKESILPRGFERSE